MNPAGLERLDLASKLQTDTKDEKAHFCDMVKPGLPVLIFLCRRQADEIEALKSTVKNLDSDSDNRQQLINRFTAEAQTLRDQLVAQQPEINRLKSAAFSAVNALRDNIGVDSIVDVTDDPGGDLLASYVEEINNLTNKVKNLEGQAENRQQLINRFTTEANVLRKQIAAQQPEINRLKTAAWTALRALHDGMKTD